MLEGNEKGAYLLIVELSTYLERWRLSPGIYAYVGSAWGPGGLIARVRRHLLKRFTRPRWHVDWLTSSGRPLMAFLYPGLTEDELYQAVSERLRPAVKGFGSSDTKHYTHLFVVEDIRELIELFSSPSSLKRGGEG